MTYSGRTLAKSTGADALQASMAASRLRANAASRGVRRIGVVSARAACADSLRSTSAKYASAFFPESIAMCAPTMASNKSIIGDGTDVPHGGGRSNSTTGTVLLPPKTLYSSLEKGCNHSQAGGGKVYGNVNLIDSLRQKVAPNGSQPASCAPVASRVWGAA